MADELTDRCPRCGSMLRTYTRRDELVARDHSDIVTLSARNFEVACGRGHRFPVSAFERSAGGYRFRLGSHI